MSSKTLCQSIFQVIGIVVCLSSISNGIVIDIEDGLFVVNATIQSETLHISIVAETMGYVAFGVSPEGRMTGSDIIVAGYDALQQTTYIGDHFIYFRPPPVVDTVQNANLISASENGTHTFVSFTRPLDSGDTVEDLPIQNQIQFFIWAIGSEDTIGHHVNRGAVEANLFES